MRPLRQAPTRQRRSSSTGSRSAFETPDRKNNAGAENCQLVQSGAANGAAQVFKKWLSVPSAVSGPGSPLDVESTKLDDYADLALDKHMIKDHATPIQSAEPEVAGAEADETVDYLRQRLLDERARRESAEQRAEALRLQVSRGDRIVERAVERAVKQTIELHEDAFRKTRELLQQQLAAADGERDLALAKAAELARELSKLREKSSHSIALGPSGVCVETYTQQDMVAPSRQEARDLWRRLEDREALVVQLQHEGESMREQLLVEGAKLQQAESESVSLKRTIHTMSERMRSLQQRCHETGQSRLLAEEVDLTHRSSQGELIAEEKQCAALDAERKRLLEQMACSEVKERERASRSKHLEDQHRALEARSKNHAREVQTLRTQIENLTGKLAEANAQVSVRTQMPLEYDAATRALQHERECNRSLRAELTGSSLAASKLETSIAELATSKAMVSAEFDAERTAFEHDRRRSSGQIRTLTAELKDSNNTQFQQYSDSVEQLLRERDALQQRLSEAQQQNRTSGEQVEMVQGRIVAERCARKSLESLLSDQTEAAKELSASLKPLHDECVAFIHERERLLLSLTAAESEVSLSESRLAAEMGLRKRLEGTLAQYSSQSEGLQQRAGIGLVAGCSTNEGALLKEECQAMGKKVAAEQQTKALQKAELQCLQKDLTDLREKLKVSDALVAELRSGVSAEDSRRHEQEELYNQIIVELRRSVASEEASRQNQAMMFGEEWDEMARQLAMTEAAESAHAETLRREREYWFRSMPTQSTSFGGIVSNEPVGGVRDGGGYNLSASSISLEMPSMMSTDLVGAAGLVGNLNESTVCVADASLVDLVAEPSASTIVGNTIGLGPRELSPVDTSPILRQGSPSEQNSDASVSAALSADSPQCLLNSRRRLLEQSQETYHAGPPTSITTAIANSMPSSVASLGVPLGSGEAFQIQSAEAHSSPRVQLAASPFAASVAKLNALMSPTQLSSPLHSPEVSLASPMRVPMQSERRD